jgi:molybdopterin/thiamine biosynthesis adenylyltransferase
MLDDQTLERFSRQILLPEVGGRGQERLLAARVALAGDAGGRVADLLRRAGVGRVCGPKLGDAAVLVDLTATGAAARQATTPVVRATCAGARVRVTTFVGRPCVACLDGDPDEGDVSGSVAPAAALARAALAATECLRVLLLAPAAGRDTIVDLGSGATRVHDLPRTAGCAACRGSA